MKKISMTASVIAGIVLGGMITYRQERKKVRGYEVLNQKNDQILKVFAKWMGLKAQGKLLAGYLLDKGYQSIAIYGMHYLGNCLLEELKNSDVEVRYAIDQNAHKIDADIDVITIDDDLQLVDAIVVTAFSYFDQIENSLIDIVDCPVVSLRDIVYEMENYVGKEVI